jgi:enoyl-CoA hydratase/carnithine racemase
VDSERATIAVTEYVADVRMTRGDKHNGLDWRMFVALNEALDELAGRSDVRVVVLSGEGPSFCAGLDFKSFAEGNGDLAGDGFAAVEGSLANYAQRVAYGWRELDVPVIAAVRGACIGGGLQIALGADVRITAPDAKLCVKEVDYGLVPDMSLWQTLPRLVGDDVARELAYTARMVGADEAMELGLVTRIADDPLDAAVALAREIAARSPDAISRIKRLANEVPDLPAGDGLAREAELQKQLLGKPNQIAAVTATMSGQPAEFSERT